MVHFKVLLVLIAFQLSLLGCNLCKINIPNVHITSIITPNHQNTKFHITWEFDKKFISSLTQYDQNKNQIFETNEQAEIKKSLLEYFLKLNYLTQIAYTPKDVKITKNSLQNIHNITYNFEFIDNKMLFHYYFGLPFIPIENHRIVLNFTDIGNNFNFIIRDVVVGNYEAKKTFKITNNKAEVLFYELPMKSNQNQIENMIKSENTSTLFDGLKQKLDSYRANMEHLILDIRATGSILSYSWLLFFSFLYGVLHAIGPGHGKSLVGAYFLGENHSVKKAFTISALIGVVHTFSAFILTVSIYFILNMLFSNIFGNIEKIATKISGIVIILVALYLMYKKYKTSKLHKTHFHNHRHLDNSCCCGSCTTKSTDLGVILSAGIIPCAGTVSIFLFTIGLGAYFIGFLSAIFMSLGMSIVIFITAYLSKNLRDSSSNNTIIIKFFEYGSLIFILIIGVVLLS